MRKAKFWVMQIVMIAIVGLVFGSPVLAGPPDHAKGVKGVEMKNLNADDNAKDNANENANFEEDTSGIGGTGNTNTGPCGDKDDVYGDGSYCA